MNNCRCDYIAADMIKNDTCLVSKWLLVLTDVWSVSMMKQASFLYRVHLCLEVALLCHPPLLLDRDVGGKQICQGYTMLYGLLLHLVTSQIELMYNQKQLELRKCMLY